MTKRTGWLIGGTALCMALAPGIAAAQAPSAAHNGFQPPFQAKTVPTKREDLPPALPGAESNPDEAARAGEPTDLQPTDALFDAINRGDMPEARDALSRGADVQGHNVLGMTPLALSIDLSRKDITFLLLSYRGSGSGAPLGTSVPVATAKPKTGKGAAPTEPDQRVTGLPRNYVGKGATAQSGRTASARGSATTETSVVVPSGHPGIPAPQAGFLGFGGG